MLSASLRTLSLEGMPASILGWEEHSTPFKCLTALDRLSVTSCEGATWTNLSQLPSRLRTLQVDASIVLSGQGIHPSWAGLTSLEISGGPDGQLLSLQDVAPLSKLEELTSESAILASGALEGLPSLLKLRSAVPWVDILKHAPLLTVVHCRNDHPESPRYNT